MRREVAARIYLWPGISPWVAVSPPGHWEPPASSRKIQEAQAHPSCVTVGCHCPRHFSPRRSLHPIGRYCFCHPAPRQPPSTIGQCAHHHPRAWAQATQLLASGVTPPSYVKRFRLRHVRQGAALDVVPTGQKGTEFPRVLGGREIPRDFDQAKPPPPPPCSRGLSPRRPFHPVSRYWFCYPAPRQPPSTFGQ